MTSGPLITEVVLTFCLAAFILYKYGDWKRQNILVTFGVLIAWYFSFLIIFVLPLDVSSVSITIFLLNYLNFIEKILIVKCYLTNFRQFIASASYCIMKLKVIHAKYLGVMSLTMCFQIYGVLFIGVLRF